MVIVGNSAFDVTITPAWVVMDEQLITMVSFNNLDLEGTLGYGVLCRVFQEVPIYHNFRANHLLDLPALHPVLPPRLPLALLAAVVGEVAACAPPPRLPLAALAPTPPPPTLHSTLLLLLL